MSRNAYPSQQRVSKHFDEIGSDPDIDLLETSFENFLLFLEKYAILSTVWHIDEDAHQFVSEDFTLMLPVALDHLRLGGASIELLSNFLKC